MSSPIADFGIVIGVPIVQPQDRLAYYDPAAGNIRVDRDPSSRAQLDLITSPSAEGDIFSVAFSTSTPALASPRKATVRGIRTGRSPSFLICSTRGVCETVSLECHGRNAGVFPPRGRESIAGHSVHPIHSTDQHLGFPGEPSGRQ